MFKEDTVVTADTFEAEVTKSKGLLLVDVWATWCSPCKQLAPAVVKLCEDNNLVLKTINADSERPLVVSLVVRQVPTFILFNDGVEVYRGVSDVALKYIQKLVTEKSFNAA